MSSDFSKRVLIGPRPFDKLDALKEWFFNQLKEGSKVEIIETIAFAIFLLNKNLVEAVESGSIKVNGDGDAWIDATIHATFSQITKMDDDVAYLCDGSKIHLTALHFEGAWERP